MLKIDSVEWGKIVVDGQEYEQVLLADDEVMERDSVTLHQLFGTTHQMSDLEVEKLLAGKPEVIIIGNGWDGVMELNKKLAVRSKKLKVEVKVLRTPAAVEEYNRLVAKGKKVNALIHTTC